MTPESFRLVDKLIKDTTAAIEAGEKRSGPMAISDFKPLNKNTVRGVFTLILPSGMKINGCLLHQRDDGGRWVGLPSIPRDVGGKKVYSKVIEFTSKEVHDRFQLAALAAVSRNSNGGEQ